MLSKNSMLGMGEDVSSQERGLWQQQNKQTYSVCCSKCVMRINLLKFHGRYYYFHFEEKKAEACK